MNKLSVTQAKYAVIVALLLGLVFSGVQIGFDLRNERNSLDSQVSRMLETIRASASRAVFNVDRGLAENVVDSLLKFLPIYSVTLVDDFGEVLASREKELSPSRYPLLTSYLPVYRTEYSLKLSADDNGRSLGQIDIKVFGDHIVDNFIERSALVVVFGTLRNILLAIALGLIFHYTLTGPLTHLTRQLSVRSPDDEKPQHVSMPRGHEDDELGELTDKLNYYLETTNRLFKELTAAEQTARRNKERFQILAESGSDWYWEMDSELRYVARNGYQIEADFLPDFGSVVGKTRQEVIFDYLPDFEKQDTEKWQGHFSDIELHKPFRDFQYAAENKDGDLNHIRISGKPVFDEEGNFTGYYGTGTDVTEAAESKRALEISEARYREIFNNAQLGISRSRISDGKIVEANERAAEILGYADVEDLIDNYVGNDAWVVASQREQMKQILAEDNYIPEMQAEVYCPDGSRRWIRSSISADLEEGILNSFFVDATEHIQALDDLAILNSELELRVASRTRALKEEILERTRAEEARRSSEEQLRMAIDSFNEGFIFFDHNQRLVLANSRMDDIIPEMKGSFRPGRSFDELLREVASNGPFPGSRGREEEWCAEVLEQRKDFSKIINEDRTVDGRWLRVTETRTADGGEVSMWSDITNLKQALEDLEAAQENMMQQERLAALGQLAATVSHELRNPLGAMQSSTYFLKRSLADASEKEIKAIERVERNIERCDRIIDELLDFTRSRSLNLEILDFNEWTENLIEEFEVPEGISLHTEYVAKNSDVSIDSEYFRRVVINLFENACQALSQMEGSESLEHRDLTISTHNSENNVCLTVRDSGVGMTEEVLKRIFEPMFSTKGFGVGLGLAMVKQIVERHEGEITVRSTPGAGTAFTVSLPVVNAGDFL